MATFETGFEYLLLSGAVKIYWGDGTSETIASPCDGPVMHEYTGEIGAEFFVAFDDPTKVLEMRMESNLFEIVAGTLAKFVNMQELDLENTTGEFSQADIEAMPNLRRIIMIGFGIPGVLDWTSCPLIAVMDLRYEDFNPGHQNFEGYAIDTIPNLTKINSVRLQFDLTQFDIDTLLAAIYANRDTYTGPDYYDPDPAVDGPLYLDLSSNGGVPSGAYEYAEIPTLGFEYIYHLVNDPEEEGFLRWKFEIYQQGVFQPSYVLTLDHTGSGATPTADPTNSENCEEGSYVYGEVIAIEDATPDSEWEVGGWHGTDNDEHTGEANTITMPAEDVTAGPDYITTPPG